MLNKPKKVRGLPSPPSGCDIKRKGKEPKRDFLGERTREMIPQRRKNFPYPTQCDAVQEREPKMQEWYWRRRKSQESREIERKLFFLVARAKCGRSGRSAVRRTQTVFEDRWRRPETDSQSYPYASKQARAGAVEVRVAEIRRSRF